MQKSSVDLEFTKELGEGAFGKVYLTKKKGYSEYFCTKVMNKKNIMDNEIQKYAKGEMKILKEINHPNIIKLIEIKEDDENYYIVTEYCNGENLNDCLEKYYNIHNEYFSEQIVQHIMRQLVRALDYLHGKGVLHRDLKLDNIMVNFKNSDDKENLNMLDSTVKIIDFGFARHLRKGEFAQSNLGSAPYKDPTLLLQQVRKKKILRDSLPYEYDEKIDIWSLGILCYEMLMGEWAFDADNLKDLAKKVNKGDYYLPSNSSKEMISFMNSMLQYKNEKRKSAKELLQHPFIVKNYIEFEEFDEEEAPEKIYGDKIKINAKHNKSIAEMFDQK